MNIPVKKIIHCSVIALLALSAIYCLTAVAQNQPPSQQQPQNQPMQGQNGRMPPPNGMPPQPPPPPQNGMGPPPPPPPPPPFPPDQLQKPADAAPPVEPPAEAAPASNPGEDQNPVVEDNPVEDNSTEEKPGSTSIAPVSTAAPTQPETITETKVVLLKEPMSGWPWLVLAACIILFLGWWYSSRKTTALANETERLARNQRHLQSAHQHLKQHSEQLRELSIHDPLTGTLNRQAFAQDFRKSLDHLAKFSRPMNLIVFDLDHFKSINDKQGHLAGDNALKLVVGIVRQHLVSEDLFSRFGGDEFVIACADQPIQATFALAEKIRLNVVEEANAAQPALTGLSLSMGISQSNPELGYDPDRLFERADKALYAAKHRGRNQVIICDDSLPDLPDIESTRRHL